jgi:hypothetical protein
LIDNPTPENIQQLDQFIGEFRTVQGNFLGDFAKLRGELLSVGADAKAVNELLGRWQKIALGVVGVTAVSFLALGILVKKLAKMAVETAVETVIKGARRLFSKTPAVLALLLTFDTLSQKKPPEA